MHTQPKDPNGTDLPAVVQQVAPNTNVIFSDAKIRYRETKLFI